MADEVIQRSGTGMKRRGILAAAGAVVAGIVAKQTAQPVLAAGVVLGADTNAALTKTAIINNSSTSPRVAFHGYMAANAVQAAQIGFDVAVAGTIGAGGGYGVFGEGPGIGVFGRSTNIGVQGYIPGTTNAANTYAVQGANNATGVGGVGVQGQTTGSAGGGGAALLHRAGVRTACSLSVIFRSP
jgi:hypothetical protein